MVWILEVWRGRAFAPFGLSLSKPFDKLKANDSAQATAAVGT